MDRRDAQIPVRLLDPPRGLAHGSAGDSARREIPGEKTLQVRATPFGGLGVEQQGSKLPRRRTEQRLQIDDRVHRLGDFGTEQSQGAKRVQPRGDQMGALERFDGDGALVQPGKPGALPHAGSGVGQQLMRGTEVHHDLGVAVGKNSLPERAEAALDLPNIPGRCPPVLAPEVRWRTAIGLAMPRIRAYARVPAWLGNLGLVPR